MPIVNIALKVPSWIHKPLRRLKLAFKADEAKPGINLWGDRDVEYSFIVANIPMGPGNAIDFGCGPSNLGLVAALRGFKVLGVDLEPQTFYWQHPEVAFRQVDLLRLDLAEESLDMVINCSAVEHVGLVGRFGVSQDRPQGDIEAMGHLRRLLKPGGIMLLTIPCGRDAIFVPMHRVYGRDRLPRLLQGYAIEKEEFWVKDSANRWNISDREKAFQFEATLDLVKPNNNSYALACFVLRKPKSTPIGRTE